MKSFVRSLVPPAVLDIRRRLLFQSGRSYKSYNDALQKCGLGYDSRELAEIVLLKTKKYRDELSTHCVEISNLGAANIATAVALSATKGGLNVIDFGGACGAHYFLARKLFGEAICLNWSIVETGSMISAARQLEDDRLKFHENIEDAVARFSREEGVGLVFSSTALQYVDDPMETLRQLVAVKSKGIFIARVAMTSGKTDGVIIQKSLLSSNGPGKLPDGYSDKPIKYPVTIGTIERYKATIGANYDLILTYNEEPNAYYLNGNAVAMITIFGRLKHGQEGEMVNIAL